MRYLFKPSSKFLTTIKPINKSVCTPLSTSSVGISLKELVGGSDVEMFEIFHLD